MRYLPDHKITFIHNPKTAGTSISAWLDENFRTIEGRKHGNWKEVDEFFPNTNFTFGVVRNPWARIASWYKFVGYGSFESWILDKFVYGQPSTMNLGLAFKPQLAWANQWYNIATPQADWLGDKINYTLRFESLSQDFKKIQRILDCDKPLPVLNSTEHYDYRELYNEDTKEIIKDYFIKDIVRYEYAF